MVIFNGSDDEQSLLHMLENMVPEAMSDAQMILYLKWDGRKRLIVDGHTFPRTDLDDL